MHSVDPGPTRLGRASCSECGTTFYYDLELWDGASSPAHCTKHYRHSSRTPVKDSDIRRRLRRLDPAPRAIAPILPAIVAALTYEKRQKYVIFGEPNTGKATDLPIGLISSPEIRERGPVAIVDRFRGRTERWAANFGSIFYGSELQRGDTPISPCGQLLAVGYHHRVLGTNRIGRYSELQRHHLK